MLLVFAMLLCAAALEDDPNFLAPRDVDLLLTDIKDRTLREDVARILNTTYLSETAVPAAWPLAGIVFGPHSRAVIVAPVQSGRDTSLPRINVFFVVDTGAPYTYFSHSAFSALHVPVPSPNERARLMVNGVTVRAYRSERRHADVSVLGVDFFEAADARLTVDYYNATVSLTTSAPP